MEIAFQELIVVGTLSLLLTLGIGPVSIKFLRGLKTGATILEELPTTHQQKAGTPVMGGIIFLAPLLIVSVFALTKNDISFRIILGCLVYIYGFAALGFADDYLKVVKRRSLGLKARDKLLGQTLVALLFLAVFLGSELDTSLAVPFVGYQFDLGYLYIPFMIIMATGASNAVNLTDGMDGLLSGCMVFSCLSYLFIALALAIPGVAVISAGLIGSLLGFLRYNYHPARVFMGDTGSLALGGALTAFAILTKTELLLVLIGGVYVLEAVSVILQVSYFKLTKGKRIFRMSPIHYHFHLSGWSEVRVVWMFWFVSGVLGLLGLFGLVNIG